MDCDSWVSVGEMEDMIAVKLGIRSASAFGLFEVSTTEDERSVAEHLVLHYLLHTYSCSILRSLLAEERVLDLVAVWQHIELEDIASGKPPVQEEFRFFYKVCFLLVIFPSSGVHAHVLIWPILSHLSYVLHNAQFL